MLNSIINWGDKRHIKVGLFLWNKVKNVHEKFRADNVYGEKWSSKIQLIEKTNKIRICVRKML